MSVYEPPRVIVPIFNNYDYTYYQNLLMTLTEADNRYLYRVLNDTASGRINFAGGMRMPMSRVFPPVVMTSNIAPAPYVASSSTAASTREAYRLFDYRFINNDLGNTDFQPTGAYTSGTGLYAGVVSTTIATPPSSYSGEWAQIQLPSPIILRQFYILPRLTSTTRAPVDFVVLGSNDGSTWVQLFSITGVSWIQRGQYFLISSPTTAYSYYRLAVNRVSIGGTLLNFSKWILYDSLLQNSLYYTAENSTGLLAYPNADINFNNTMIVNSSIVSSLQFSVPNSTGLSLVNNSTLGMWSPASNVLSFGTIGSQEMLRLDATNASSVNHFAQVERILTTNQFVGASTSGQITYNTAGGGFIQFSSGASIRAEFSNTLNRFVNQNLDMKANNLVNAPQVGNSAGNLEVRVNNTAAGGTLTLTGGTGLLAPTSGGSAGQHLVITINGVNYKIALQTV